MKTGDMKKGEDGAVTSMRRRSDVIGGLIVMTIGTGFLMVGRDLDMGSSFRMGPGYFPTVLSVLMIPLGLAITMLALRCPAGEGGSTPLPWRGLLLIIGGAVFFGFAVRGLGLAPVVLGVVLASAWASRYAALRSSLSLSAGLAVFCTFLFIQLLGLPLPLTGPWLSLEQASPLASAVALVDPPSVAR